MLLKRTLSTSILFALTVTAGAAAATTRGPTNTSDQASTQSAENRQSPNAVRPASAQRPVKNKSPTQPAVLQAVKVVGIRRSQMHAIERKRTAAQIEDDISAVSIGQLPNITVANSLAQVTGVEIDRRAGEGTTINIRGLPEVTTLMNGESFLSADNIYNDQPDYETLPSSLFSGISVYKSPTADLLTSGISGTVNLRTRQPWQLPFGWTIAGSVEAGRGQVAGQTKPNGDVLINYNAKGRWGVMLDASYSDFVHSYQSQGFERGSLGGVAGENSSAVNSANSLLTGWSGSPVPSQITTLPDGSVTVNGISNGAFYTPPRFELYNQLVQPKRKGLDAAFQYALGSGFTLTADAFYTNQTETEAEDSIYSLPVSQTAPTSLPLVGRGTGAVFHNEFNTPGTQSGDWNQQFYSVQKYSVVLGALDPNSVGVRTTSISKNYNVKLDFDNGGPFTGSLRWVSANAYQHSNTIQAELTQSNGAQWPNTLAPGVSLPATVYAGAGSPGTYVFNPSGIAQYLYALTVDQQGSGLGVSIPGPIASSLENPNDLVVKGIYGNGDVARGGMNILRFDGHYRFSHQFSVDFGFRNSLRTASLDTYKFENQEYGGEGASNPAGCLVHYTTSDIVLNGGGVAGACTAGNQFGFYRGNMFTGPVSQLPHAISGNIINATGLGGIDGVDSLAINGNALTNPWQYYKDLEGNATWISDPASSWNVMLHTRTLFGQANFRGTIAGHKFSGNAGVRIVRTNLGVTQNLTGAPQPYGNPALSGGRLRTSRQYQDILPAINVAFDLTDKLILRLAGSKNMMPLSLNQWGGGFSRVFQITSLGNGQSVEAVTAANSTGNPDLKPWRSTNFGASLEYYMNPNTLISLAAFNMRVASFIETSSVIDCGIPDEDGVVRRCVPLTEPVQGSGAVLHGFEFDYREGLTFLPGLLRNTGFEVNATYSPSTTDEKDLSGQPIPFPGNSKKAGNLVLWYQDSKWSARAALNYRSAEAVQSNYAGVNGFELYKAPQKYLSASVAYRINKNFQIYAQGQNLTNQRISYYAVWPDERLPTRISERFYMLGVRFRF